MPAKYSIASITLMAVLFGAPRTAPAGLLNVTGVYTGNINGTPLAGNATGSINTDGPGGNLAVTFSSIANSTFTPMAVGGSFAAFVSGSSAARLDVDAPNLFDLSGGNYTVESTFTYPTLAGSTLTATGTVSTVGSNMSYTGNFSGTYTGPTDIVGVKNYGVNWYERPGNTVLETSAVTLLRSNGATFVVWTRTTYGGLSSPLLGGTKYAIFKPTQSYVPTGPTTGVYTTDWNASIRTVPEPSALALFGLGALGILGGRLLRRRAGARSREFKNA